MKLALIATFFLLAGCVLKSEHDDVVARNIRAADELTALKREHEKLKAQLEETQKKSSELESRNEELSNVNQMLVGKNQDLSRRSLASLREALTAKEEKSQAEDRAEMVSQTYGDLVSALKDEIAQGQVAVAEQQGRISVNVADQVLFPSGSDQLQANGKTVLRKVVPILKRAEKNRIQVEGHTDNVPIRGSLTKTFPTNWELSAARAIRVVRYLEENGVPPGRLVAAGFGQHHPVASNESSAGRQKNRRIEIVLTPAGGTPAP